MTHNPPTVAKRRMKAKGTREDPKRGTLQYWRLVASEDNPETGKRRQRELGALGWTTEAEAERARVMREAELRLGLAGTSSVGAYTVRDALADLVDEVDRSGQSKSHRDRTFQDAANLARHLGDVLLDQLRPHHPRQYIAGRGREAVVRIRRRRNETEEEFRHRVHVARRSEDGKRVSGVTIRGELVTLRRAVRHAAERGLTTAQPPPIPHHKSIPKDARPPRRLAEQEVRRLVNAAYAAEGPRLCDGLGELVEVLSWSGRRPIAIFHLTVGDCRRLVDTTLEREQRHAFFARDKGGESTGWGPLTEPAYQAVLRRLEQLEGAPPGQLLWTTWGGHRHGPEGFSKLFNRYVAEPSQVQDVRPYDLRKHACAQLLRRLGNPHACIQYSGHKTVEVFLRSYGYLLAEDEADPAKIGWTPAALQLVEEGDQ